MVNRDEVKRRREALGLTLDEAAKRAGFSGRQRWYGIEAGERKNVTPSTLLAVARVLGCSMEEIVLDESKQPKSGRKGK